MTTDRRPKLAAKDRGVEQTLGRTVVVLDALAAARDGGQRFTDLVAATGFSNATVHRLLAGLVAQGFVDSDPASRRLFLGFRIAEWGAASRDRHGLVARAEPFLRELAQGLGDTVYISVRDGPMAVCAALYEGPYPIRAVPLTAGDRNALGVGSGSLGLLAFLPEAEIEQVLADPRNATARDRRGVGEAEVRRLVALSRERGFALVDDLTPGISALALPIPAASGTPRAAVSVASVHDRMREPRLSEVVDRLRATVAAIADVPTIATH